VRLHLALAGWLVACTDPSVVGTWHEVHWEERPHIEERTWRFTEGGSVFIGDTQLRYQLYGERLRINDSDGESRRVTGFVLENDLLVVDALFVVGQVDGPVGTWVGLDGEALILDRDGSAQLQWGSTFEEWEVGTWREDGDWIVVEVVSHGISIPFFWIDGSALGRTLLERVE
jgi:hypothetical protein